VQVSGPKNKEEMFQEREDGLADDVRADRVVWERSAETLEEQEWEERGWKLWVGIKKV